MSVKYNRNGTGYGLSQALLEVPGIPIQCERNPTGNDKTNIGTLWINDTNNNVFILTSISNNTANWELVSSSGGVVTDFQTDTGLATPALGLMNLLGGSNINTDAVNGTDTITINLNDLISLPNTNSIGSEGIIEFGGNRWISNYGSSNTFLGADSGNTTLTPANAINNTGVGSNVLNTLTDGSDNVALGNEALTAATTASFNTSVGGSSLSSLTTGVNNIALGNAAGANYVGNESNNIIIGNNVGDPGDDNILRIGGGTGTGVDQQIECYISGIYNQSVGSVAGVMLIDSDEKIGSTNGTDGQILIADTGGKPAWANITSSGGSVTITNGPNSINLEAAGVAALTGLDGDAGSATPVGGIITIAGDGITTQTSAAADTVTVSLTNGTDGQLLIGGGTNPIWANLTSSGGTVTITNGPNSINLEAAGVAALTTLGTNSGTATPTGGNIDVLGTNVIETAAAGDIVTIELTNGTDGQVLIGGGAQPTWSTLTAGSGVSIVNAANSITISASGSETTRPAFFYRQAANYTVQMGSPTPGSPFTYLLGSGLALTQEFDFGSNVFPGNGTGSPATFTAPVTGVYWFKHSVQNTNIPIVQTTSSVFSISVIPSGSSPVLKEVKAYILTVQGFAAAPQFYRDIEGLVFLNMNDTVQFGITYESGEYNADPSLNTFGLLGPENGTYIMGYLVQRTA